MILINNRFWFVATPRTGSRSMTQALTSAASSTTYLTREHHPPPSLIADRPDRKPVVTMIRRPDDMLISWWNHAQRPMPFVQFVETFQNGTLLQSHTLYPYTKDVTLLPFEWGLHSIMALLGFPTDLVPTIGMTDPGFVLPSNVEWLEGYAASRIRFYHDWGLWHHALGQNPELVSNSL